MEMTHDGVKSDEAKNLIGGIKFKGMKKCHMFKQCNYVVCSDWTLNVKENLFTFG